MRFLKHAVLGLETLAVSGLVLYGGKGWLDAHRDAPALITRANAVIAEGRGGNSLGNGHLDILLAVQDPGFANHNGIDLTTPGAGLTTLTQSLAKRLAFDAYEPGIAKLRQTTYAYGLSSVLSKEQQVALFLETAEMGRSESGWVTGFFNASTSFFGRPPDQLDRREFISLVATLIAPAVLHPANPDQRLIERIERIERLIADRCQPVGWRDVWLEGCASQVAG